MRATSSRPPLAALAVLAACAGLPGATDGARSLAEAETAFAAQSMREGMRAAFIASFDADGVMVRNGWVNARAYLEPRPDPGIVLDWRPAYVEVAASGELGLSTGPWKLRSAAKPEAPPAYGQFVSIWRRDGAGRWKVAVDLGISHPQPTLWSQALESVGRPAPALAPATAIAQAEARFSRLARDGGERAAHRADASSTLRFYRPGIAPAIGKDAALAALAEARTPLVWNVERIETARSGDFGYARGHYADASRPQVPRGYFLRVWRLEEGEWRVALEVTNPAAK